MFSVDSLYWFQGIISLTWNTWISKFIPSCIVKHHKHYITINAGIFRSCNDFELIIIIIIIIMIIITIIIYHCVHRDVLKCACCKMPCNTYGSLKKQIIPSKHHVSINHDPLLSYPAWHYILTRPAINEYIQKTQSNYWDVVMESLHMIMQAFLLTLGNFFIIC